MFSLRLENKQPMLKIEVQFCNNELYTPWVSVYPNFEEEVIGARTARICCKLIFLRLSYSSARL